MKILGVSGSPRKNDRSGVYTLVETVLKNTGYEYELISLRNKTINGCIACLGCVKDNVCVVQDDLTPMREKFIDADAIVFGAPNYYCTMNATAHAVMERFFQFRHQTGDLLWGKLAVAVGVGGTTGSFPADEIEKMFLYNFVETIAKVTGQGAASCYSCGHGETCQVGIPLMMHGEGVKITEDMIPDVCKQKEVIDSAVSAGQQLRERLKNHDRVAVTRVMQEKMMAMFGELV